MKKNELTNKKDKIKNEEENKLKKEDKNSNNKSTFSSEDKEKVKSDNKKDKKTKKVSIKEEKGSNKENTSEEYQSFDENANLDYNLDSNNKKEHEKKEKLSKFLDKNSNLKIFEVLIIMILTASICVFSTILIMNETVCIKKNNVTLKDSKLKEFEEVYDIINSSYYKKTNKSKLIEGAIDGMLKSLNDPHTSYFTKEQTDEFNTEMSGSYKGIGAEITIDKDNNIIVYSVFKGSPAEEAGLKYGDKILEVDGKSTSGKTTNDVSLMIRNDQNAKAKIKIERDGSVSVVEIEKRVVEINSVESKSIDKNNKKIGYIVINTFADNTYSQFKEELEKLEEKGIDSLVIDVRSNTGGYLHSVTSILNILLPEGKTMYQISDRTSTKSYQSTSSVSRNYPIAVIIDGSSASASEILAIAMQESYGATIIGTNSYGKGTVQTTKELSNGGMFKYTIQKWLSPKGNWINEKGVTPDVKVELSDEYFKNPSNDNDNQLQKALDIISKK